MTLGNIQQSINSLNLDTPQLTLSVGNTPIQLSQDPDPIIDNNYLVLATTIVKPFEISTLGEISGFVSDENIDFTNLNWLPSQLSLLEGLGFSKLELLVNKNTKKLEGIDVVVSLANHWSLIPNVFTFDELNIGFLSFYSTDFQQWDTEDIPDWYSQCQIFGKIALGNGDVRLDAKLDSLSSLSASLSSGSEIDLSSLLAHLLPGADAPTLKVEELTMNLDFDSKTYDMTATVFESWEIVSFGNNKLELEEIILYLSYAGGEQSSTTGEIIAAFNIAECDITLTATHLVSGEGWQFSGSTGTEQAIPIGKLIAELDGDYNPNLPSAITNLKLDNLGVSFNTKTKDITFEGTLENNPTTAVAVGEQSYPLVSATLRLEATKPQETQTKSQEAKKYQFKGSISGKLQIKNNEFNVAFNFEQGKHLTGSWQGTDSEQNLNLASLASDHGLDLSTLGEIFQPDKVNIEIDIEQKELLVKAHLPELGNVSLKIGKHSSRQQEPKTSEQQKPQSSWFVAFGLEIQEISTGSLPVVGEALQPHQISLSDLRIIAATADVDQADASSEQQTQNKSVLPLGDNTYPIKKGMQLRGTFAFQESPTQKSFTESFEFAMVPKEKVQKPAQTLSKLGGQGTSSRASRALSAPDSTPPTPQPKASQSKEALSYWINVQKSLGPVNFKRVGLEWQQSRVWLRLDAALSAGGITLGLDGFGLSFPLKDPLHHLEVGLKGLEIDYSNGPITIGGGFLREKREDGELYAGQVIIKAEQFSLNALGSYFKPEDKPPSLFIFAFLGYPLGGPPFFFVTGLAAGVGFNRSLKLPSIDEVKTFPLVAAAIEQNGGPFQGTQSSLHALGVMEKFIEPEYGEIWLAAGVRFTCFEQLDCFALVTISFGNRFELGLLGFASVQIPAKSPIAMASPIPPIAYIEVALEATLNPEAGLLAVQAKLTTESYIFSKDCHLTGGFAFYVWFSGEHEGDFVITLGGYHSHFTPPDYYPQEPRLGLSWKLGNLSIQGGLYFALTASALMAGGFLEANFHQGGIKAWFNVHTDFLISWKPLHFEAEFSVSIGCSVDLALFTLSVHIGVGLHLWGNPFGGTAWVDLTVISFTISFGADRSSPKKISWDDFESSFLLGQNPESKVKACEIRVGNGLVKDLTQGNGNLRETPENSIDWIINAEQFLLILSSKIPIKKANFSYNDNHDQSELSQEEQSVDWNNNFGVGPVGLNKDNFSPQLTITLTRKDGPLDRSTIDLQPSIKSAPKALWQEPSTDKPKLEKDSLIDNILMEYRIVPKVQKPDKTLPVDVRSLQTEVADTVPHFDWQTEASSFSHKEFQPVSPDENIINALDYLKVLI
ncbi:MULTISPECIES: DUF6603 domain-containing protein [unclassified Nostoc]|uniref:DUF6603 domain-containing protein n=1 Tax=unclassified Nostoc TaxID=2593658 RepID=UPI002613EC22|nr:DUF6603 domain-containing protein [Nostoc sp. S13]MDF5736618.1 hypothetical protein [Nostoc sp. S13]